MLKFACADVGVSCDFVTTGETLEEVKNNAFAHAKVAHKEIMEAMSEEELAALSQAVEANIKPA